METSVLLNAMIWRMRLYQRSSHQGQHVARHGPRRKGRTYGQLRADRPRRID